MNTFNEDIKDPASLAHGMAKMLKHANDTAAAKAEAQSIEFALKEKTERLANLRLEIINSLHDGVSEVNFVKVDGTNRKMLCTLVPSMMDDASSIVATSDDDKAARPVNPDIVKCYDVEAMGWRSFRVDSVIDWSIQ